MQLDAKDIEAIGKSRAKRTQPQNIKNWMYGGLVVVGLGVVYWLFKGGWLSVGVMFVGVAIGWYGSSLAGKWRRKVVSEINAEWLKEEREGRKQS